MFWNGNSFKANPESGFACCLPVAGQWGTARQCFNYFPTLTMNLRSSGVNSTGQKTISKSVQEVDSTAISSSAGWMQIAIDNSRALVPTIFSFGTGPRDQGFLVLRTGPGPEPVAKIFSGPGSDKMHWIARWSSGPLRFGDRTRDWTRKLNQIKDHWSGPKPWLPVIFPVEISTTEW